MRVRTIETTTKTIETYRLCEVTYEDGTTCDRRHVTRGMCNAHRQRAAKFGDPLVGGKLRKYRERTSTHEPGERFGNLTLARKAGDGIRWICRCDCGREAAVLVSSLAVGDAVTCGDRSRHYLGEEHWNWAGSEISYRGAHRRVAAVNGPASARPCIDCSAPAAEWSYAGGAPDEQVQIGGPHNRCAYSPSPAWYVARCVPCHARHDGMIRRGVVPLGNAIRWDLLVPGVDVDQAEEVAA